MTDEQWEAAHTRLQQSRITMTTDIGQRALVRRDYESKDLLTGFVRCATCGGSITVVSRQHGQQRVYFYGCLTNWKRGAPVCANDLVLPIDRVNEAVLKAIGGDVLRPAVVTAIIDGFLEQLLPANVETRADDLRRELRALDAKIAHLAAGVEQGGPLASLVALLTARQAERDALLAALGAAEALHQIQRDRTAIEAEVQAQVGTWRALLNGSTVDARQMLREVLEAPLRFERDGKTYRFSGPVATGKLIAGVVLPTKGASPRGGDRGRQPTSVASPTLPSWNQIADFLERMQKLRDSQGFAA